ncbi:MAG: RND family transporter [Deltaproteobacteria bacterium]|nr:RND family transporter [Deltaproteobacteria bacterium]
MSSNPLISRFYDRVILARPKFVLALFFVVLAFFSSYAGNFRIDASSDTLVMKDNKDFLYYQKVLKRYGYNDFLIVTYSPKSGDLFSDPVLARIASLKKEFLNLPGVGSVVCLLDVPLLASPPVPIKDLAENIKTLSTPGIDRQLAKKEFKTSPLYSDLIVSPDLKTTALQIVFKPDKYYEPLWKKKLALREKAAGKGLSPKEEKEYKNITQQMDDYRDVTDKNRHNVIVKIRAIMMKYTDHASLYLGGISMIADDMMAYVKNDLKVFSVGVFLFLVVTLGFIFRQIRWVLLPVLSCAFSAIIMIGILGYFDWEVTVISSNFISLQLIMTMAMSIHLVVRYRELSRENPDADHRSLVLETISSMLIPIFYAGLTTIAGFASLLWADILPVITFGWMMCAGLTVSLLVTFIFFPATLALFKKSPPLVSLKGGGVSLTRMTSNFTQRHGRAIILATCLAFVLSIAGISQLIVENSFVNYFRKSSEIYKGLTVIDKNLGGTTPLDVIIDFDDNVSKKAAVSPAVGGAGGGFDVFDEFESKTDPAKYWLTPFRLARIEAVHDYLAGLDHVGKVLSLATLGKLARQLNNGTPLDSFDLSLIFNGFPDKYKKMLVTPYVSVSDNEARIALRVRDSDKGLRRNALLKKIEHDMTHTLGFKPGQVHLTSMLVLYNDILQRLFESQILTLGIVLLALMGMFLILFRSIKISLIAIFPNLLSIGVVLGVMGWFRIPLDIMTITIASISVGIAVDDTIHYIHRFKHEIEVDRDYVAAMHRCHESIGYAMYYTSITIVIGFSTLVLSNFIPTINFGLLTCLAMVMALVGALTLLPELIILIKPFGPGRVQEAK